MSISTLKTMKSTYEDQISVLEQRQIELVNGILPFTQEEFDRCANRIIDLKSNIGILDVSIIEIEKIDERFGWDL